MTDDLKDHDDAPPLAAPIPPEPPPAPRAVTPLVRRRAWAEKHVRPWWLMAAGVLLVAGYYAASKTYLWRQEARLIETGTRVEAEVMHWEPVGKMIPGKVIPAGAAVQLEYTVKGRKYNVYGDLPGRTSDLRTAQKVTIIIDPADPNVWSGRTEAAPLAQQLLAVIILLPMAAVLFGIAVVVRGGVIRVYRDGAPVLAEVVAIGHSASAPGSRLVRCAVHVGNDARIVKVLLPPIKTPPVGELLWLITPPNRPHHGIPAALFD